MAVQPEYINPDIAAPVVDIADATHVAFAIDDLPELAEHILALVITVAIDDIDYDRFHTAIIDRLRGTTANSGAVDDGSVQH